ncbi:Nicotinamidase-related amidase [Shimia gijangensis]|uniref:Nicotinamidase-related amidase n=1 Tax=Shimia gijangensis TaxID=1470563 RepID=A0A1M6TRZ5_9RHOB|nr:cysteine hydrolase family protein [Shimia gijangensis]SHK59669.1 Nicotinamidase-related amidase [Shimia gijangensis]
MHPALLLIDIETAFRDLTFWGARNNPDAEDKAGRLLTQWRKAGAPVVHIRHVSTNPGSPLAAGKGGTDFMPQVAPLPGETVFEKSANSAFIGTTLEAHLRDLGVTDVVTCGLTTPHCVSTTSRMAANLGFNTVLAHDACAAFASCAQTDWNPDLAPMSAEDIHNAAIAHIHGEFLTARTVESIIADLT